MVYINTSFLYNGQTEKHGIILKSIKHNSTFDGIIIISRTIKFDECTMIGFERCTPETDEVEVETALRYGKDKF